MLYCFWQENCGGHKAYNILLTRIRGILDCLIPSCIPMGKIV